MTQKLWTQRIASVVLVCTLLIAVAASAQAAISTHLQPAATAEARTDSGLTTIFGTSARSLQLLR